MWLVLDGIQALVVFKYCSVELHLFLESVIDLLEIEFKKRSTLVGMSVMPQNGTPFATLARRLLCQVAQSTRAGTSLPLGSLLLLNHGTFRSKLVDQRSKPDPGTLGVQRRHPSNLHQDLMFKRGSAESERRLTSFRHTTPTLQTYFSSASIARNIGTP